MFWWFIASLREQCLALNILPQVVVVDFWAQELPQYFWKEDDAKRRIESFKSMMRDFPNVHVPPKPTPWQGKYRLTKKDYFAAANARNTAICYSKCDYIAFVDDLSVLLPGWLATVIEHKGQNRVVCGAFKKVKGLVVQNGAVVQFDPFAPGVDSRWNEGKDGEPIACPPNWLFGCSFGCPTQYLLDVNGLCEDADSTGLGLEDCALGRALGNNGHHLWYDRRMLTYESEERHHNGAVTMVRMDKKRDGTVTTPCGVAPNEKGHHFVSQFWNAKRFSNYFPEGGIAAMRQHILSGGQFPTGVNPQHDWFDAQPLTEL